MELFDTSGFVPRKDCGSWSQELIWLHNGSDVLIWLSYMAIPLLLIHFIRRRRDMPFPLIFWLFGAFILSCGFTHLMDAVMFYAPLYRLSGVVKLATAFASVATVVALVPVIPKALTLRSPEELEREIVERKRAEETLHERDELWRAFIDHAADGFFLHGDGGVILDVNRRACESLGYSREELLGKPVTMFDPDVTPDDIRRIGEQLAAGQLVVFDSRHRRKDGTVFPVEIRARSVDVGGQRLGMSLACDITERKQTEDKLRRSEERYRCIVQDQSELVCRSTPDCQLLFVNDAYARCFGRTPEELVGQSFLQFIPQAEWQGVREYFAQFKQEQPVRTHEHLVVDCEGRRRWQQWTNRAFFDDQGRAVEFQGVARDITEQKLAEQELRRSEERLRLVAQATTDAHYDWDIRANTVWRNDGYQRLYDPSEPIGADVDWWLGRIHADDRQPIQASIQAAFQAQARTWSGTYRLQRHNDDYAFVLDRGYVEYNAAGQPVRFLGAITDLTEMRRTEQRLRESEERLQLFVEHAPASLAMFDRDMRYLAVSQRWITDYHLENRAVLGHSHYEVFPEIPERWKEVHRACLAGLMARHDEDRFVRQNGTIQWLRWEVRPWHAADGAIGGIVIFTEDITEKKLAEDALLKSEAFLRLSQRVGRIGSWEWEIASNRVRWSEETACLYGISLEEFDNTLEMAISFIHPDDLPRSQAKVRQILDGGGLEAWEYRIRRPDGSERYLWASGDIQRDASGRPITVVGAVIDITERHRAEEALRDSESRYRQLIDGIQAVPWEADPATFQFSFVGTYAEKLFGYPVRDWYEPDFWTSHIHADDRESAVRQCQEQTALGRDHAFEYRMLAADGRVIWVLDVVTVAPATDGRAGGLSGIIIDITAQKTAQETLRLSETRYRELLDYLPAAAYTCDANGLITYFNQQAIRLWGRVPALNDPADRFSGAFKLFAPDGSAISHEQSWMAQALRQDRPFDAREVIMERPDGSRRIVLAHVTPTHDENGKLTGAVNMLVDITTLRESQEVFETFMRHSPAIAFVKSADDRLLYVNKAFEEQIWDGQPPDWQNRTGNQIWPPAMAAQLRANDVRILASGKPEIVEEAVLKPHRTETWLSFKFPLRLPTGQLCLAGMALNVTDQRQAQVAIRESEERFRQVVEASNTAIIVADQHGRMVLVNAQTEKTFGHSRAELLDQPVEMLIPERFRGQHPKHRTDFLRNPAAKSMGEDRQLYGLRKDGTEFLAEISLNPVQMHEETLVLVSVMDVTDRKRMEAEQARLLSSERLARAEAEAAQRRFAFLAESSRLLSRSRDPLQALSQVALVAVPFLADWCMVDLLEEDGGIRRFAPDHPPKSHPAWKRLKGYGCALDAGSRNPIVAAICAKETRVVDSLDEGVLLAYEGRTATSHPDEIRRVNVLVVPLQSRHKVLGAIAFVSRTRSYQAVDQTLVEDLARRVTYAVDNVRLLQETEQRTDAMRALASELSAVEDRERRRLALDLHDSIGQNLTVIKLNLESAAKSQNARVDLQPLNASLLLLEETIEHARNLMFDLYPAMLDDLGLSATLRWYAAKFKERVAIEVDVEERGQESALPRELANYLFRAVKELLNNVAKHAHASQVVLSLIWRVDGLRIVVTDDGSGISRQASSASGLGLRGIRERLSFLGGKLLIEATAGRGTQVILDLPYTASAATPTGRQATPASKDVRDTLEK